MLCLIFAGPLAVGAIFSISAVGNYFAFAMPIVMRHFFAGPRWQPGPWTLGRYSLREQHWFRPSVVYPSSYIAIRMNLTDTPIIL